MKHKTIVPILALAASALVAQDHSGLYLKAGVIRPYEDLIRLTEANRGLFMEGGYLFYVNPEKFGLRAHGGYFLVKRGKDQPLPATAPASDLADVRNLWLGVDVVYPFAIAGQQFEGYFGVTQNSLKVERRTAGVIPDSNWKFGYRIGVAYRFTTQWSVDMNYGNTEMGQYQPRLSENAANRAVNRRPSWLAIGAAYKF